MAPISGNGQAATQASKSLHRLPRHPQQIQKHGAEKIGIARPASNIAAIGSNKQASGVTPED